MPASTNLKLFAVNVPTLNVTPTPAPAVSGWVLLINPVLLLVSCVELVHSTPKSDARILVKFSR